MIFSYNDSVFNWSKFLTRFFHTSATLVLYSDHSFKKFCDLGTIVDFYVKTGIVFYLRSQTYGFFQPKPFNNRYERQKSAKLYHN